MLEILLSSLLIMTASLVGVVSAWKTLGSFLEKNLRLFVSFSAGVFLIVSLNLGKEVFEHSTSVFHGALWMLIGVTMTLLLFKILPSFHHHHDPQEHTAHDRLDARRIVWGDGLHNLGDGVLIASSYIINPVLGVAATASVFVHEVIQEISEFFVLQQAGFSIRKALLTNFLVSGTILLSSTGTFLLFESFERIQIAVLGVSAGAFLVVVFHDLIPHSVRSLKDNPRYFNHILFFSCGIVLMLLIGTLTSNFHSHGNETVLDSRDYDLRDKELYHN